MALYHEAAAIIAQVSKTGALSLDGLIFDTSKSWRSEAKQRCALVLETVKWRTILSEVVEGSQLLQHERKLSPSLALVLVHDQLLRRNGTALSAQHPLTVIIGKHKTRLCAELTKARLRRKIASIADLESHVEALHAAQLMGECPISSPAVQPPRWIRINTIKASDGLLDISELSSFTEVPTLAALASPGSGSSRLYIDATIPNLIAIPSAISIIKWPSYQNGSLIIQDRASCFPAQLLCHNLPQTGSIIDACAAPGNKTTHMAALTHQSSPRRPRIHAVERDTARALVLTNMVKRAGAEQQVYVRNADFLGVRPEDPAYADVLAILLDPSCSGSGMLDREPAIRRLQPDFLPKSVTAAAPSTSSTSGKRHKRQKTSATAAPTAQPSDTTSPPAVDHALPQATAANVIATSDSTAEAYASRLQRLSNLQTHLLKHAMRFPSAQRIVYSTCSIHVEENEAVVQRALASEVGRAGGWRVMRREEQPEGLRDWEHRGEFGSAAEGEGNWMEVREGCVRCLRGGADGTGGFFVCGFVREQAGPPVAMEEVGSDDGEEWNGFGD